MGETRDGREFGTDELPSKDARIAELEAEVERLTKERQDSAREWRGAFDSMQQRATAAERALAERAGGVKVKALEDAMRRAMEIYQADEVHDVGEEMFMELHRALTAEPAAPEERQEADWRIDTSAGSPILVYQNCSVIQDEQAEYVLDLIRRDTRPAEPAVTEAMAEAALKVFDGGLVTVASDATINGSEKYFRPLVAMRAALTAALAQEKGR